MPPSGTAASEAESPGGASRVVVRAVAYRREVVLEADAEHAPLLRAGAGRFRGRRAGESQIWHWPVLS